MRDTLALYRRSSERIGVDALKQMGPAAREAALCNDMASEGSLHPALLRPDGHYRVSASVQGSGFRTWD